MVKAIAIGDEKSYLVHADSKEILDWFLEGWYNLYDTYFERCGYIFRSVYREIFDIPQSATMAEEDAIIIDNYGSPPAINPAFAKKLRMIQDKYEKLIGEPPNFVAFAEEHHITLEEIAVVIEI